MKKILLLTFSIILWINFWTLSALSISFLIFLALFIPKKFYNPLVRFVCRILSYSTLIFPVLKTDVSNNFPFPVIFVANHVSFFDLFISGTVLPGYPRGLELKEHFSKPIYGWFITKFGQIPIDNKNPAKIRTSLNDASNILLRKERNLLVMPEGTRTKTGDLGKFKIGAFFISKKTNVPIVPVIYKNLYKLNNRHSLIIKPGILKVYLLDPVYPENFASEDEMAEYVRSIMQQKLDEKI